MKAKVKKDTCIGCGACTVIADKIFQIGDDGLAEVIETPVKEEHIEDATNAKESCPTEAIEEA